MRFFNDQRGKHASEAVAEETNLARIGRSTLLKGELSGDEDLMIEGRVEGAINVRENLVTVGQQARVDARIVARTVIVAGKVRGQILAGEKVDIRDTGSVEGDITTLRLAIALGAYVRGCVDVTQSSRDKPSAAIAAGGDADPPDTPGASAS